MRIRDTFRPAGRAAALFVAAGFLSPIAASASDPVPAYPYATPIFGFATAPDGSFLVADYGSGVVELRNGQAGLVAELPTVTDVAPIGRGDMFALTGKDPAGLAGTA